jgi:branched-chain amino acid transport system permease protein
MIIIGGVGSILGSFLGAAFITLFPILLNFISKGLETVLGVEMTTPWCRTPRRSSSAA